MELTVSDIRSWTSTILRFVLADGHPTTNRALSSLKVIRDCQ